jgi:hypothetical protein
MRIMLIGFRSTNFTASNHIGDKVLLLSGLNWHFSLPGRAFSEPDICITSLSEMISDLGSLHFESFASMQARLGNPHCW